MPLDLTALERTPTAEEVQRVARTGAGAPPHPTVRTMVLALVSGGVVTSAVLFWVLREDPGPVIAALVAGVFLVADLAVAAYLHRTLTRTAGQARARLHRFARDNGLDADERPRGTSVPGRVLGHPTATVLRRWRRRQRPLWEVGVVEHQATKQPTQRTTRYVALDAGQRLPRLLVAAPWSRNRPGQTSTPVELVPYDLDGLWPPREEALPSQITRDEGDEAAELFGEDNLVHADEVVSGAYPHVLTTELTARLERLGVGSLEVADGWLVATTAVREADDSVAGWRRTEQLLDLLEELRGRLAAL